MKILYVTDLHGHVMKYEKALEVAKEHNVHMIINGGDFNSSTGNLFETQDCFINDFLDEYFQRLGKIYYILCPGNDDLGCYDELAEDICNKYDNVSYLKRGALYESGYFFINFDLVPDYMFGLKDRVRREEKDNALMYTSQGLISTPDKKYKKIWNWHAECQKIPSIDEELQKLAKVINYKKAIFISHCPPAGVGLDLVPNGYGGSKAIAEYILNKQPLLSLHGHFHESPNISNKIHNYINKTLCIQPGQIKYRLIGVIINIEESGKIEHTKYNWNIF